VVGIITGGRPHPLSTYPGLLPDVDILLYSYYGGDEADFIGALDRAEDEDVDVVLFELASWVGHFLDGSEYVERTIDDLMEDGVVQVCPAGNLAGNGKHTSQVEQDGRLSFPFTVPEGDMYTTYWYLNLELHVAPYSFVVEDCLMTTPDGGQHEVLFNGEGPEIIDGLQLFSQSRESNRSSDHYQIFAFSQAGDVELPPGQWSLDCAHGDAAQRPVHAFVGDNATGWSRGIVLGNESDASTLCWPSTADTCISVGASAGRVHSYDEQTTPGQLHGYSSRGPRINGEKTIDVVAPADAYTASPTGGSAWISREPAEYGMFSGTSGAGPHVAALAAQLVQAEPDLDGNEIRALLQQGALVDDQVDVDPDALPDDNWGYGKVRGVRALTGSNGASAPDRPVEVTVDFESQPGDDGRCRVTATPSAFTYPDATFRWDWAYDGRFEGEFEVGSISYQIDPGSELTVRVQAASDGWWIGGGLGLWSVPDNCRSGNACSGCGQGCGAEVGAGDVPRNLGVAMLLMAVALVRRGRS
jgi:subtilisin family serine protease